MYAALFLVIALFIISSCKKAVRSVAHVTQNSIEDIAKEENFLISASGSSIIDCAMLEQSGTSYTLIDRGHAVDYLINCQMVINGDLTIMPGVCIEFTSNSGLKINEHGSLLAVTTSDAPIKFTGVEKTKGFWSGIVYNSNDVNNKLDGVYIEYAGGESFTNNDKLGAVVINTGTKAEINNCNISNSASYGINATYGNCALILNNNKITTCTKPIYSDANYIGSISGGTYTGNDQDVIYIDSNIGGLITSASTWNNLMIPYQVKSGGAIRVVDVNLTILPGVIIKFETGTALKIQDNSSLKALGTATNPIVFTGVDRLSGYWGNIEFNYTQSALNEIGYAIIEHKGTSHSKGIISMWANPKILIHDVVFRKDATCAFYDAPKLTPESQTRNPNLTTTNNIIETIGNQKITNIDSANSSYCFGG